MKDKLTLFSLLFMFNLALFAQDEELCPPAGPTSCAFIAAKLAYKVMGYITSINHKL